MNADTTDQATPTEALEAPQGEATEEELVDTTAAKAPARRITIALPVPNRGSAGKLLIVLALVIATATAAWQWRHAGDLEDELKTRDEIGSVAGRFGQALLSYDHDDLGAARQRVLALATKDFGKTYEVAFTGSLQQAITELKADADATVRVVYLSGGSHGSAQAVIVMDSQVKSTAGTRNVTGSYLQMDLTKENGRWKVSAVTSIGAVNESLTPDPTATPKPTPAKTGS